MERGNQRGPSRASSRRGVQGIGLLKRWSESAHLTHGRERHTGQDRHLALWRVPEGKLLASYHAPQSASGGQSFAAASDLSLVALIDSTLRIVDLSTGDERWSVKTDNLYFSCAAFSPDGKIVVTAEGRVDSSIRIWDVATGKELGPGLKDHRVQVMGLVFFPDGKTLASSSFDQTIRLWDVSDPTHVQPLGRPLRGHTSPVAALALMPDNKTLVSGSWDGSIHAWDTTVIRDGQSYVTLPGVMNWSLPPTENPFLQSVERDGSHNGRVANSKRIWPCWDWHDVSIRKLL